MITMPVSRCIRKGIFFGARLSSMQAPSFEKMNILKYSSAAALRTSERDPTRLNESHAGRLYTIDNETVETLFGPLSDPYSVPEKFKKQCITFRETCLLVRRPFLTIKNDIESYGVNYPPLKFVIYGERGNGKSLTMANLVHYGHAAGYVLFNIPWLYRWTFQPRELVTSLSKEGFIDHTEDSVVWLSYFRRQNAQILKSTPLKTVQDYVWNQRESTPAGSDLLALIEHGIARPVYAAESICALVSELKALSTMGKCKVMVLIDGINGLFAEDTIPIKRPDRTNSPYDKITVFQGWKQLFTNDWSGGVIITTVDGNAMGHPSRESDLPRYLLQKEGWEMLDPFIPVEVERYSRAELNTILDYYVDRKWLQHPKANTPEARQELEVVSVRHPFTLMHLCNAR